MLVTAAGTLSTARVLAIGAGVAALQAIAAARRLGGVVEDYDTRPAVKEQVQGLGARFVELPLETADAEAAGGHARAQSEEFYVRQRAPRLIEVEAVQAMRPGSVIVDLAAEQGGNCAVTEPGARVSFGGVTVLGPLNLPSAHPLRARSTACRSWTRTRRAT